MPLLCIPSHPMPYHQMMQSRKLGETLTTSFKPDLTLLPKHVLEARVVLTFEGYFKEAVVESGTENFRVRRVIFKYHTEDDTCRVLEAKVRRSFTWSRVHSWL